MSSSKTDNFDELSKVLTDVSQRPVEDNAEELLTSIKSRFVEVFESPEAFPEVYCANLRESFETLIPELDAAVLPFFSFFSLGLENILQLSNPSQNVVNKYLYFYESPALLSLVLQIRPQLFIAIKHIIGKNLLSSAAFKPLINILASDKPVPKEVIEYAETIVTQTHSFKHPEEFKMYYNLSGAVLTRLSSATVSGLLPTLVSRSIRWFSPERKDSIALTIAAIRAIIKGAIGSPNPLSDSCRVLFSSYTELIPLDNAIYAPLFTLYSTLYNLAIESDQTIANELLQLYSAAHVLYGSKQEENDQTLAVVDSLIDQAIRKTELSLFLSMLPLNLDGSGGSGRAWLLKRIENSLFRGDVSLVSQFFEYIAFFREIVSKSQNTTILVNLSALISSCFIIISKLLSDKESFDILCENRDNEDNSFYDILNNIQFVIQNFLEETENVQSREAAEAVTKGLISLLEKGHGSAAEYIINTTYANPQNYIPAIIYGCFLLEGDVTYDNLALQVASICAPKMSAENLASFIAVIFKRKNVSAGRVLTLYNTFLKGCINAETPNFPMETILVVLTALTGGENPTRMNIAESSTTFREKRFYNISTTAMKYMNKHDLLDSTTLSMITSFVSQGSIEGQAASYVSESARSSFIETVDYLYQLNYFGDANDRFLVSRVVSFLSDAQSKTIDQAVTFINHRLNSAATHDDIIAIIISGFASEKDDHAAGCLFLFEGILSNLWTRLSVEDSVTLLQLINATYSKTETTSIKIQILSLMREWVSLSSPELVSEFMPSVLKPLLDAADKNPNSKTRTSLQNLVRKTLQKSNNVNLLSGFDSKTLHGLVKEMNRKSKQTTQKKTFNDDFITKMHTANSESQIEDVVIERFDPKAAALAKKYSKISKNFLSADVKKTESTLQKIKERKNKQSKVPHHKKTIEIKKGTSANPYSFRRLDIKNYKK